MVHGEEAEQAAIAVPWSRVVAAIAMTAVIFFAASIVASHLWIAAAFSSGDGLGLLLLVPPIAAVAVLVASRAILGRWRPITAVAATLVFCVAEISGFLGSAVGPVLGALTPPSNVGTQMVVCVLSACVLGLAATSSALRWAVPVALVGLVVVIGGLSVSAAAGRDEAIREGEQTEQAAYDEWLATTMRPVLTDAPGWRNTHVALGGTQATTWMLRDDGAVAVATTADAAPPAYAGLQACGLLTKQGDAPPVDPEATPEWCRQTDRGWARDDGAGFALLDETRITVVVAAEDGDIATAGGTYPAGPDALAEIAAATIRPMSDDESRAHLVLPGTPGSSDVIVLSGL